MIDNSPRSYVDRYILQDGYRPLIVRLLVCFALVILLAWPLTSKSILAPELSEQYKELLTRKSEIREEAFEVQIEKEREIARLNQVVQGYAQAQQFEVKATAYTARPEETNENPERTAMMGKPRAGWTIAVSRDLMHWMGKRVYIEGKGVRLVNDLLNKRYDKKHIDILKSTVSEAEEFGVQTRKVYLIEPYMPVSGINKLIAKKEAKNDW